MNERKKDRKKKRKKEREREKKNEGGGFGHKFSSPAVSQRSYICQLGSYVSPEIFITHSLQHTH